MGKYEDLNTLDELRSKGAITEEEYQREKTKILNANYSSYENPWGMEEKTFLLLMHLSQFLGLITVVGYALPIVMWLTNKENVNVDKHGKNIINFMLSWTIYSIVAGLLCLVLIGIPILIALGITYIIFVIMAAVKASNGEYWDYPMTVKILS